MTENLAVPPIHVTFRARVGENAEIAIAGTDVSLITQALLHFGLGTPQHFPAAAPEAAPVAEAAPAPAPAEKKTRAKKDAAAPVEKPAATQAEPAPSEPTPSPSGAAEPSAPETAAAPAASSTAPSASPATPEEAAAAVKAFGAKNGIDAARALLQQFGFARTGDITAEKAGEIVQAASV